mgnify:FL=1|tara:strand:+ start:666 stop:1250 length:585 start_codon:yes stop_codon:yes gene_type:complete
MDDFDTFCEVFHFFLSSELDTDYVQKIDSQLDNKNKLIDIISSFHEMRRNFCKSIIDRIGSSEIFNSFVNASNCLQYNSAPKNSTCIFSNVKLNQRDGILIVVDNQKLFTFHKRLKVIVLTFWYLLHLPAELVKESLNWQSSKTKNSEKVASQVVSNIFEHNDRIFPKRAYVRFLNTVEFIQKDMKEITVIKLT